MKVAAITIGNLYRIPYLDMYFKQISAHSTIDIINWNREGKEEKSPYNLISFNYPIGFTSKLKKIEGYARYRRFVANQLRAGNYDLIIVTPTNTALLMSDYLIRQYRNRYILDIRDYCHEALLGIKKIEASLVSNAAMTVISSEGYKTFLPQDRDYVVVHNSRNLDRNRIAEIKLNRKYDAPIKIGCIGSIVYHDSYKRLIRLFGNDQRFELAFIGYGSEGLSNYCKQQNVSNVLLSGEFLPEETLDKYADIDVVNGVYGDNHPSLDYALSNKLYFAAELEIPILVTSGTFMEEMAKEYNLGVGININDSHAPDVLYDYLVDLDRKALRIGANRFIEKVEKDNNHFESRLDGCIESLLKKNTR